MLDKQIVTHHDRSVEASRDRSVAAPRDRCGGARDRCDGVRAPGPAPPCNLNKNAYICRRMPELTPVPVCFV